MKAYCPALLSGKYLPQRCAHASAPGGQNVSPPVVWGEVPPGTKSFAFTMIDSHPAARGWVHWLVINIAGSAREIRENSSGVRDSMPAGALELRNDYGTIGYGGPNPQRGSGPHDYVMTVYALSVEELELGPFSTLDELKSEMHRNGVGLASVVGMFQC